MPRPCKYKKLIRTLLKYDDQFEVYEGRGKGSERMIYHPNIQGRAECYPVKCHSQNTELSRGTVAAILRRFNLPKDLL